METAIAAATEFNVWDGYEPTPLQAAFHNSWFQPSPKNKAKIWYMKGGFGSGKTRPCLQEILRSAIIQPNNIVVVARKYRSLVKNTTMNTFWREVMTPDIEKHLLVKHNKTDGKVIVKAQGGESCIMYRGLEDDGSDTDGSLKSFECGDAFVDEADQVREGTILTLMGRMRLSKIRYHRLMLASNPTNTRHWLYSWMGPNGKMLAKGAEVFTARAMDNPYLPQAYLEQLKATYTGDRYDRYVLGEWGEIHDGDPVFPQYKPQTHKHRVRVIPGIPIVVGWDFGFRRPAAVFGQVVEDRLVIHDAILGENETLGAFADKVLQRVAEMSESCEAVHFGDIAGTQRDDLVGQSRITYLRETKGIVISARKQGIDQGLDVIRNRLSRLLNDGQPVLIFSAECDPVMLDAMDGGYHYEKEDMGKAHSGSAPDPKPVKDGLYDHVVDALRYLVVGLYGNSGIHMASEVFSGGSALAALDEMAEERSRWMR